MIEPAATSGVLIASISTALVFVFGALYLLLFTISQLRNRPGMMILAYACFAVLLANVLVMATLLHLSATDLAQALGALLAYLLIPHAVRRLVVGSDARPAGRSTCCSPYPAE